MIKLIIIESGLNGGNNNKIIIPSLDEINQFGFGHLAKQEHDRFLGLVSGRHEPPHDRYQFSGKLWI